MSQESKVAVRRSLISLSRKLTVLVFFTVFSIPALGAGFAVLEQSAKREGTALAGSGAAASDASAIWFNPATLSRLDNEFHVSTHYIVPKFEFSDRGSVQTVPGGTLPLLPTTDRTRDGGDNALVPSFAWARPINDSWDFGVTLNAPFGLSTDYGTEWQGRYQAVKSEITDYNLNPAVAWQIDRNLTLGFGLNVNYVEVTLTNAIDFAAICASQTGTVCPNGALPGQGQFDGFVDNSGDDISYGYNVGLLWEISPATRVGLSWRSEIKHELEGDADFTAPDSLGGFTALGPLGSALGGTFRDTDIEADLDLPATFSASLYHRFGDGGTGNFAVLANLDWTGWSSLGGIRIDFENPATPTTEERLDWDDVWRVSLGTEYYMSDRWTLRAGVARDSSPVPNARLRSPRVPGNDRTWIAFGATRALTDNSSVDMAIARNLIEDTPIAHTGSTGDRLIGEYESNGTIVSLEYNHRF